MNSDGRMNRLLKIAPSMMCADFINLKADLDVFHETQVDYLHIDIMDGHYVPNFTLGVDFCRQLDGYSDIPLDIHLMVENPEKHIPDFSQFKDALVSFHPDACYHPFREIQLIKSFNAKAGIAVDPALALDSIKYMIPDIDFICIMTVNPGYSGQKLIPQTINKIKRVHDYIYKNGYQVDIEVDGNVSWKNLPKMLDAGANIFVAGTSSIFEKGKDIRSNSIRFKNILEKFTKENK